jgi:hypothetical protein
VGRDDDADRIARPGPEHVPVHRQPQLRSFLILGAGIGLALGVAIGVLGPDAPNSSLLQEIMLLGALGVLFGGLFGGIAFLVADRFSQNR